MKTLKTASPKISDTKKIKMSDYFVNPIKKEITKKENSRKETIFLTEEENHYLETHDNSKKGKIRNFTAEDLKMFN